MLSQFNVVKRLGNDTFVFNTLTASFIKMPTSDYDALADEKEVDADLLKEMYRQGILVDDRKTEVLKYKYFYYGKAFDRSILILSIAPTMKCNFCCEYCFEGDNKTFPAMTKEVEDAIVNYLLSKKERAIYISWFGGEPLLAFPTIYAISERLNKEGVDFHSNMITNGSLFTDTIIENLQELNLTYVQISLDGVGETHDKRRHYKNGKPSFSDVANNIDKLLAHNIRLTLQVTVDNNNATAYQEVYEYMNERYPRQMEEKQLQIACNHVQDRTSFDTAGACFSDRQLHENNLKYFNEGKYEELIPRLPGLKMPCMYRSASSFAIDSKGYMYRCLEHLGQPARSVGNVVDAKVSFAKMATTTFFKDPFEDEECLHCSVLPICGGGCPVDCEKCSSKEKNYCSYYKTYLSDLLPEFYKTYHHDK